MVKSVWGSIDGIDVIFSQNQETGKWETTIPASLSGTYIIELWANDYAGNVGYFATIRVTFDPSQMCVQVTVLNIGSTFSMRDIKMVLGADIVREIKGETLKFALLPDTVNSKIVRCEVCGE